MGFDGFVWENPEAYHVPNQNEQFVDKRISEKGQQLSLVPTRVSARIGQRSFVTLQCGYVPALGLRKWAGNMPAAPLPGELSYGWNSTPALTWSRLTIRGRLVDKTPACLLLQVL